MIPAVRPSVPSQRPVRATTPPKPAGVHAFFAKCAGVVGGIGGAVGGAGVGFLGGWLFEGLLASAFNIYTMAPVPVLALGLGAAGAVFGSYGLRRLVQGLGR